jgi:hypothetical protein
MDWKEVSSIRDRSCFGEGIENELNQGEIDLIVPISMYTKVKWQRLPESVFGFYSFRIEL